MISTARMAVGQDHVWLGGKGKRHVHVSPALSDLPARWLALRLRVAFVVAMERALREQLKLHVHVKRVLSDPCATPNAQLLMQNCRLLAVGTVNVLSFQDLWRKVL